MKRKRGTILVENILFIILTIAFLTILILFFLKQGSGAIVLEQAYAKQKALMLNASKPGMILQLRVEKKKKKADDSNLAFEDVIKIKDNFVTVKVTENSGYSYGFFNDVDVNIPYLDEKEEVYVLPITNKNEK